jgi:ribosomal protein S18 acetylase RimI-like enzyme
MIVKNKYVDQLTEIFDNNNQNYVSDRSAISNDRMDKIVYVLNNKPVGYAVLYKGVDFCQKEKYPIIIKDTDKNSIYIWHMVIHKDFSGHGIGTKILKYIIKNNSNSDIYSCVDVLNIASIKCHKKAGFKQFDIFSKKYNNKVDIYKFLKHTKRLN